jgi:hypothetical protein
VRSSLTTMLTGRAMCHGDEKLTKCELSVSYSGFHMNEKT